MSSILKALKKVDSELPQQNENQIAQINTKHTIQKRIKGIWIFQRLLPVLFVTLILTGSMWLILKQKPMWVKKLFPDAVTTEQRTESIKSRDGSPTRLYNFSDETKQVAVQKPMIIPEKKAPSTALPKRDVPALKESRQFEPISEKKLKAISESAHSKKEPTEKIVKSVGNVRIEIEKPSPSLSEKRGSPPVLSQKKIYVPVVSKSEKEIDDKDDLEAQDSLAFAPEESPEEKKPLRESDITKVEDDSRFKLQALVWSPDPKSCFVVINDRITRIGSSIINGVFLDSIGEDYVIIQEGDKKWKQMFQMK